MKQPVKRQAQEPDNVPIIDIKLLDELINDRVLSGEQITGIASSLIRSRQTQGTTNMSSLPYVVKAGGYGGESLPARFTFLEAVACCCCYQLELELELELERRAEKFHITLTDLIEALKQVFRNGPNVFFYYCQSDDDGEFILNQAELYARLQDAMDKMSPFLSVPLLPVIQAAWAVSKQYYPALATFEFKSSEGTPAWIKKDAALHQFNIGWRRLEQWRLDGFVRSVKLGEGQSSARLYMKSDINDVLLALSAGRKPVVKQGRVK